MSATCDWLNGSPRKRTRVTVIRWGGEDLPEGHWEAEVHETGEKVAVRPEDLRDAFYIAASVLPASSEDGAA